MSQKVNPIVFRLGARSSWLSVWNAKKQDYSSILLNDVEFRSSFNAFMSFFGLFPSFPLVSYSTKNSVLYSKILNRNDLLKMKFVFNARKKELVNRKRYNLSMCSFFSKTLYLDLFNYQKTSERQILKNDQSHVFFNFLYFPFISAQVLTNFICTQIQETLKNKEVGFKKNIRRGILKVIQSCFNKKTVHFISGIRLICSGRFSKTKSGRTQSLSYSLGKLNIPKVSSFLDYGYSTVTTPLGSCSLHVLLCFKSIK